MLAPLGTLSYIILLCADMPQMRRFYRETLGFPIHRDWEDWLEMRAGPMMVQGLPTQPVFNSLSA